MAAKKKTTKKTAAKNKGKATPRSAAGKSKAKASRDEPEGEKKWWIRRSALQEVAAIGLLGVGVFLLLSLLSNLSGDDESRRNLCGPLGHAVSEKLVLATGLFSLAIPLVIFTWGIMVLLEKKVTYFGARVFAAVVLLLSLATLGSYLPTQGPSGGGIGAYLQQTLQSRLSTLGSLVLLFTLILAATVVATDWLLISLVSRLMTKMKEKAAVSAAGLAGGLTVPAQLVGKATSSTTKSQAPSRPKKKANPILPEEEEEEEELEEAKPTRKSAKKKAAAKKESKTDADAEKAKKDSKQGILPGLRKKLGGAKDEDAGEGADAKTSGFPAPVRTPEAAPKGKAPKSAGTAEGDYVFPPLELLLNPEGKTVTEPEAEIRRKSMILEHTLKNFKIESEVVEICQGPVITQYELELAAGIKVSRMASFEADLSMALAAESVRIVAPIPGKSTVGIEVPNTHRELVLLRDLFEHPSFRRTNHAIPLMLGKDAAGDPIIEDMAQMPHLLIAGATGSGKSVCINSIILSILMTRTPEDVQMILIDPKMVELSMYADIPHLLTPVVTDMKRAPFILEWAVQKMEERYELLAEVGVRNIASFNKLPADVIKERLHAPESNGHEGDEEAEVCTHLPYIVIVVDELADMMMTASKEVENSITRLSQKSRAVGIHIILATQRPSVDVITGLIKSNMPARISFKVASKVDSRTILDRNGAEKLLGQGDMLYLPPRTSELKRSQGTFLDDQEIIRVTKHLKKTSAPTFNAELSAVGPSAEADSSSKDDLYEPAVRIILESQRGSVSLLQRQLGVGYTRAARLIDLMAKDGLVGKYKGSQAREVLVSLEEWEEVQEQRQAQKNKRVRG